MDSWTTSAATLELILESGGWVLRRPLGSEPVVLGRDPACDVSIPDPALSRRHCRLVPDASDGWRVEDLGSRHGTFVSGVAVGAPVPFGPGASLELGAARARLEVRSSAAAPGDLLRDARNVELLVRTADELYGSESLDELLRTILDRTIRVAGGDRGALLLARADGSLETAVARDAEGRDLPPDAVLTRSIPGRVLAAGTAVVLTDTALPAQALATPHSVAGRGLRSVLCVPLPGASKPAGVLYVDAHRPAGTFGAAELGVLEALASSSALALERARLRHEQARREAETRRALETENAALRLRLHTPAPIGESAALRSVLETLHRAAASDATVCLTGETGTGKEVLARYLHRLGPRAQGPFVVVDCGALPEGLVESALFGHERGAFTGALATHKGSLREADGGTVFIDEIGELPLSLQPKLLRALQERSVQPVGSSRPVPFDVRFVCATHRDLSAAVAEGRFREDLYYRIGLLGVRVPPLRERDGDILLLARHFLACFGALHGGGLTGFTRDAAEALRTHAWPGNVRELEQRVQRAVILARPPFVTRQDLGLAEGAAASSLPSLQEARAAAIERSERAYLEQALQRTGGNVSRAAELAGISRQFCQRLLRRHGIERERFV